MATHASWKRLLVGVLAVSGCATAEPELGGTKQELAAGVTLLNVSYDPTRELYEEYNKVFATYWKKERDQDVTITQSHAGSGRQAQAVVDGLEADVVTLALAPDIDLLADKALLDKGWQARLPNKSSPYTSTIVFVVRKGNPKGIKDWRDLIKPDVGIVTPNPKTSGGARWAYLAAYGDALKQPGGDDAGARAFVQKLFANVKALDSGARAATLSFAQTGVGDVLISWENEAALILKEFGADHFAVVAPKRSILAEPPVAVVDKNVDKHQTGEVAKAYLTYLYSPEGQALVAKHHYRPTDKAAAAAASERFPSIELFSVDELFGGWAKAQQQHFADGGIFDQIYQAR